MSSLPRSGRSPGRGNGNPPQYSCLENPIDREAWQATGHGITESDTAERLITHTWKSSSPSVSFLSYREQNLSSGYTQCLMMSIRKQSTLWLKDSWVCKDHWLSRGGHGYSGEAQGHGHFDQSLYRGSKDVKQSKLRTDSWNPGSVTSATDEVVMDDSWL